MHTRPLRLAVVPAVLALVASACGGGSDPTTTSAAPGEETTTTTAADPGGETSDLGLPIIDTFAVPEGTIGIAGSSTVFPLSTAVMAMWEDEGGPNYPIDSIGSGGGLERFCVEGASDIANAWLDGVLNGTERVGLAWEVLGAFMRLMTNPLAALSPMPPTAAWDVVESWLSSEVTWGVIVGLVVGKTVGIAVATFLAVRARIGRLPEGIGTRTVIGAAALGGIGFTVSLCVADLAFGESPIGRDARLGVLIGSVLAAGLGVVILLGGRRDRSRA